MAAAGVLMQSGREHFSSYQHQQPMYASPSFGAHLSIKSSSDSHARPWSSHGSEEGLRLPSISNLLTIADGERKSHSHSSQSRLPSPPYSASDRRPTSHPKQQSPRMARLELRPRYSPQDVEVSPRTTVLPPASHIRSDSVMDVTKSPSATSTRSLPGHFSFGPSLTRGDSYSETDYYKRSTAPSQPASPPHSISHYPSPSYASSPGASSIRSFHSHSDSAIQPPPPSLGLYQQRPLPSHFPPTPTLSLRASPSEASSSSSGSSNPYQHHHHYISPPAGQAAYPPPQDRYLCPTCNKAFSRPSSLKIHTHSHTGEKPFRCPHGGCNKSFSVRSNMKRHERGCHSGLPGM